MNRRDMLKSLGVAGIALALPNVVKAAKTASKTYLFNDVDIFIGSFGTIYYNGFGQLHRAGGPACEWANGNKEWYQNGQLHRIDGPAIESSNGVKEWWLNGKLQRI